MFIVHQSSSFQVTWEKCEVQSSFQASHWDWVFRIMELIRFSMIIDMWNDLVFYDYCVFFIYLVPMFKQSSCLFTFYYFDDYCTFCVFLRLYIYSFINYYKYLIFHVSYYWVKICYWWINICMFKYEKMFYSTLKNINNKFKN